MNTSDIIQKCLASINKERTELCDIMTRNRSDKGNGTWHNYTQLYHALFQHKRNDPIYLFEIGLGTSDVSIPSNMGINAREGASHFGWKQYFPNAHVYGADIDKKIVLPNIPTFFVDQTRTETFVEMWKNPLLKDITFDIMIDDGLHEFHANKNALLNCWHKLNNGGYYIIEDIKASELNKFLQVKSEWQTKADCEFVDVITLPLKSNPNDNTLMILKKGTAIKNLL